MSCDRCELEHRADLAKSMLTVPELLEAYGFEVGASGKFALRDERTPSTHAYEDHFYDYGTGEGGDLIDLVMRLEGCTFGQAVSRVIHKALRAGREPGDVERQPVRQVMDFTDALERDNHVDSLVSSPWAHLHPPPNCRQQGADLLIPHEDDEGVYGVKVRGADGSKSAWPGSIFTKRLYSPDGWMFAAVGDPVCVITEGESDCWALDRALGYSAIVLALPSGAQSWKDHWLEDLKPFDKVYLCMDNDRAGQQARDKLTAKIGHLRAEQLRVPPLYGDAREAIAAGWRPSL
jgi:hypothetical protein